MKIHSCMSVRGALLNWSDAQFQGLFTDDNGMPLSARAAKAELLDELAKGHVVIPLGPACEGFDYSGGGCPGHPTPEDLAQEPRA